MQQPNVSIIVPAYNTGRFIRETLDTVATQTFTTFECLIIDDGSTDDSAAIAQEYVDRDPRFKLIRQPNCGLAHVRNIGIRNAHPKSEFICFLDSDDYWAPCAVEELRKALLADPKAVGSHGLAVQVDEFGQPLTLMGDHGDEFSDMGRTRLVCEDGRMVKLDEASPTTFEALYPVSRIYPSGLVLMRRTAMAKAGEFDTTFLCLGDWDYYLNLARFGHFHFVNKVVIHYRRHSRNVTNQVEVTSRQFRKLLSKHFFSKANTEKHRRIVRSGFRAFHAMRRAENFEVLKKHLREGNYSRSITAAIKVFHHSLLYVRGFPTSAGI